MIYDPFQTFKYLAIEIQERRDGKIYLHPLNLDDNPLITEETAPVWANYLSKILRNALTKETMQSQAFKDSERQILEMIENERKWALQAEKIKERDRRRHSLKRTPSLGYIPEGLHADYSIQYGYYIDSAIQWTPTDKDDFLYQFRSLERMVTKCVDRCIELGRPDAAYEQAAEMLRRLPSWRDREELSEYFRQYKPRLCKLLKNVCYALIRSSIAWNNELKLHQANALIEAYSGEFVVWGMKSNTMHSLRSSAIFRGSPLTIERKPTKTELYEMQKAKRRKEAEEQRKAAEEAEKHSLIPLNQFLEDTVFDSSHVDWECATIGRMINTIGHEVTKYLNQGKMHDALLLFLQIVKSMCRHFVSDEHYNYFDDLYDPDYSCMNIVDDLNKVYEQGKFTQADLDFFHEAWQEIEKTEAVQSYGMANFKFKF